MAAPGSENPSAAFLAGQQHGAKLAVQHRTAPVGIVKSKHDATGITDYGVNPNAKPGASPKRKTAAAPTTLLDQAKALAAADTQAQVDAIRAQQDVYTKQASDRAGQVNLAAQAAAKYLTGIGDATAGSYTDAAKTLAGFASGYSGDLRATAEGAASAQQQALAGLGAPAEGLKTPTGPVGSPTSLANVLYGLGGVIPSTLLVTAGQAQAGAQRQLPAATLGYGQQEALGVLGAGAKQADTLTPNLLAAQGKLPALTQQYLSALQDREHQLFGEKLDLAKYGTSIDQFNAKQGLATAKFGLSQQVAAFNQKYKINTYNLSVDRLNLSARQFAQTVLSQDRSYAVSLSNLGLKKAAAQRAALADEYKVQNGGFTLDRITRFEGDASAIAADAFNGFTDAKTNKKYPPLSFGQALAEMRKGAADSSGNSTGRIPVSIALKALKQAGYKVPKQYDKLMSGGIGQTATPFASTSAVPAGDVPPGTTLSFNQLASLWVQAGGDPAVAPTMAAIALAESGGRADALNPTAPDYSVSPWQINYYGNMRSGRTRAYGPPELLLRNPLAAARAAVDVYKRQGLGAWTTYTSGAYRRHLVR